VRALLELEVQTRLVLTPSRGSTWPTAGWPWAWSVQISQHRLVSASGQHLYRGFGTYKGQPEANTHILLNEAIFKPFSNPFE